MNQDSFHPAKRKRALRERNPPGIAGRVCEGMSCGRRDTLSSPPPILKRMTFWSIPHALENSNQSVAYSRTPVVGFTLNQDKIREE